MTGMYQYAFFVKLQRGDVEALQPLPITGVGPSEVPTSEMVNLLHQEFVKQAGLGAKRPTHYISVQIHELPAADEDERQPSVIALPNQNGAQS